MYRERDRRVVVEEKAAGGVLGLCARVPRPLCLLLLYALHAEIHIHIHIHMYMSLSTYV
jgi:hypothetical protein